MSPDDEFALRDPEVPVQGARIRYERGPDGYEHLGLKRRTFFRWRDYGEEHDDLPPFDLPAELESWYGRMRDRSVFKHQFPSEMREKIAAFLQSLEGGGRGAVVQSSPPPLVTAAVPAAVATSVVPSVVDEEYLGLEHELQQLRERVADLRVARDAAYKKEDLAGGDLQDARYQKAFTDLTIAEKRALEVMEKRKLLISRSGVEQDLAQRITGIVVGGMFFLDRIEPQLDAIVDPAERRAKKRELWVEHCSPLIQGQFVPEFFRRLPAQLWQECATWLQSQAPPTLELAA